MSNLSNAEERLVIALLEQVLDLPDAERAAFIDASDMSSRVTERVKQLLRQQSSTRQKVKTAGAADVSGPLTSVPERIGAYAIRDEIGRGGMGAVYLAEREAGDFEHRVAIKMILTGALSQRLVDRFRYERQALAKLNHPNIAQLFDGGETADGVPYVIMELVDGEPLSAWVQKTNPNREQRLSILEQLMDALQFAHSNLIIHRDLTPENVIVTSEDKAKLIDFGLSSFQSFPEDNTGDTSTLRTGRSGTPGFTAPELNRETEPNVSVDIYALGKIISFLFGDFADPELLAIAAKAHKPDPDDRYSTVAQLAEAVQRYRGGYGVPAYSRAPGYRLKKFCRRNLALVSFAGSFVALLLVGGVLLATAYDKERQARQLADERFLAVRDLANFQLFDVHDALIGQPGSTQVLADLSEKSRLYLDRLRSSDTLDAELSFETAVAYLRLSQIQGNALGGSLGQRDLSQQSRSIAVADLRKLTANNPDEVRFRKELVKALISQSEFANLALDDVDQALQTAQEAEELALRDPVDADLALLAIEAAMKRAAPLPWIGQAAKSTELLQSASAMFDQRFSREERTIEMLALAAKLDGQLGQSLAFEFEETGETATANRALAKFDAAIAKYEESERLGLRPKTARRNIAISIYEKALVLADLRRENEALAQISRGENLMRISIREDAADREAPRQLATLLSQKVIMLANIGRASASVSDANEMVSIFTQQLEFEPENRSHKTQLATIQILAAETFEKSGSAARACTMNRRADALRRELIQEGPLVKYVRETIFGDLPERIARTCG